MIARVRRDESLYRTQCAARERWSPGVSSYVHALVVAERIESLRIEEHQHQIASRHSVALPAILKPKKEGAWAKLWRWIRNH